MNLTLYTPEELLSHPIEHTLELLTCDELGPIIGRSRTTANLVLAGVRRLAPQESRALWDWLASCGAGGNVTHRARPRKQREREVCRG